MRLSLISLLVFVTWPASALACRYPPEDTWFADAETVLVGWVSSASAPGLDALSPGSSDSDALNQSINSNRIFRIIVTETRKGKPVFDQTVEVNSAAAQITTWVSVLSLITFRTGYGVFHSCLMKILAVGPNNSFKPSPHRYGIDRIAGLGGPA